MTRDPDITDDDDLRISILEEVAHIGVRDIVTGHVRVRTVTDTEDTTVVRDLLRTDVAVERVVVNRWLAADESIPATRTEGNVTIVPLIEEVLVVEKRMRLTEEVRITFNETTDTTHIPVELRRQRAVIERAGPDGVFAPEPPDAFPHPKD